MIFPRCILSGDNFNPDDLMSLLPEALLVVSSKPGEIGARGRFKDKPVPFGLCWIDTPESVAVADRISWMTAFISNHMHTFKSLGAGVEFDIYWTGSQGNMEFSVDELRELADLRIPLNVTYVYLHD